MTKKKKKKSVACWLYQEAVAFHQNKKKKLETQQF